MASHSMEEVTLNQHVKYDKKLYEPGVSHMLPVELVEQLREKGKIADPRAAAAQAEAEAEAQAPAPAEFTDEQRRTILMASITMMVVGKRNLSKDGKPKVRELEAESGMNTDETERDALYDELFPEEEADGKKTRPFLDRMLGRNKEEK